MSAHQSIEGSEGWRRGSCEAKGNRSKDEAGARTGQRRVGGPAYQTE